ncbi:MAG TPA: DUF3891 family protein, partial [Candidatus Caenarcaniphilales bacterium]
DIGWLPWERSPTLNRKTGRPHSFQEVATAVHVNLWSGAKHLALPFGRYVALLVSLHGSGLYQRYRGWQHSPESTRLVEEFLRQETAFQEEVTATLQQDYYYATYVTPVELERNRQLIAIWDALSLAVCQGLRSQQPLNQVPTAAGETTLTLTPVAQDPLQVTVAPWPFQTHEVTLICEGQLLRQTATDEAALQAALECAPWVTLRTILRPA